MTPKEELIALRRLAELEAKAGGQPAASPKDNQGYIGNRINAIKEMFSPSKWASELTSFPEPSAENTEQVIKAGQETALSVLPTTPMSKVARAAILKPTATAAETAKQATLKTASDLGLKIPRSNVNQSFLTNLGERFGGKQAIEATAQMKNQPQINKIAAKALGVADDAPITPEVLRAVREEAGKAYEAVKQVGTLTADKGYAQGLRNILRDFSGASKDFPELASQQVKKLVNGLSKKQISSEGAVEMIKSLREQAKSNLSQNANAGDKLLGKAQRKAAEVIEDLIERNIQPKLGKEVLESYRAARQTIAKTYTLEKALNPSTGNVVVSELTKQAKRGAPLSGELKQLADFGRAFPKLARESTGAPPSGGLFEPLVYGLTGGAATGGPGAAAALIPILGKPLARQLMVTLPKTSAAPQNELVKALMEMAQRGGLSAVGRQDNQALADALANSR